MKIIPCSFFKKDATKETMTTTFMLVQVHVDYHLKIIQNWMNLQFTYTNLLWNNAHMSAWFLFQDMERPSFSVEYLSIWGC